MSHWSIGKKMASNLADDLQELQRLLREAKRPCVQAFLLNEIANLEKVLSFVTDVVQIGGHGVV